MASAAEIVGFRRYEWDSSAVVKLLYYPEMFLKKELAHSSAAAAPVFPTSPAPMTFYHVTANHSLSGHVLSCTTCGQ